MGPQGPAGMNGAAGPQGPAGMNGTNGVDGTHCWDLDGDGEEDPNEDINGDGYCNILDCIGPAGPQGPQGPAGVAGTQGPAGPVGPAGGVGPIGPMGPQGPAGMNGTAGPQGPAGNDGATGPVGPAGAVGPIGPMGPQGPAGVAGPQGPAGTDGRNGVDGSPGAIGPIGPQGPTGATGAAGPAGLIEIMRVMDMTPMTNEGTKELTVQCPAGTTVLFGNAVITGPEGDDWIRSVPVSMNADETSWYAKAEVWSSHLKATDDCDCSNDWKLTVYAVCGTVDQVTTMMSESGE